ncbi:S66 family peptidase [Nonomuraea typhae]|uniref:S66 family peptidase n=1 Tax=Nonomuraea typhae TaxID=2603600 RepID=UPI0012F7C5D5|nr:S66 peptidase family protein [Nonomuraea typhae]
MMYPPKPRPGDKIAVLSTSAGLPGILPLPFDAGLRALREEFELVPVEFPVTRVMGAGARRRADDINAAFADPSIKAIVASIGGDDQITVTPHLNDAVIRANPKPFFGYSDNTNLLVHLWNLGLVAYHGGSVMCQFGRCGGMHPVSAGSLRAAMFTSGPYTLPQVFSYSDVDLPWDDPASFTTAPPEQPCEGWFWHNPGAVVEGRTWGGNLEILSWLLMADRGVQAPAAYDGMVLVIETSEELPSAEEVFRILRTMGERGLLARFPAVLVGRAKAWSLHRRTSPQEKAAYARDQRAAVLKALGEYAPAAMAVFDVDLGHTDPQVVIPYGGQIRVDGAARSITVTY